MFPHELPGADTADRSDAHLRAQPCVGFRIRASQQRASEHAVLLARLSAASPLNSGIVFPGMAPCHGSSYR